MAKTKPFPVLVTEGPLRDRIRRVARSLHLKTPLFLERVGELLNLAGRENIGAVIAMNLDGEGRAVLEPLRDVTDGYPLPWVVRLHRREDEALFRPQVEMHIPFGERALYHSQLLARDTDEFEEELRRELIRMLDMIPFIVAADALHREIGIRKRMLLDRPERAHPFTWAPWALRALIEVDPELEDYDPLLDPYMDECEDWYEGDEEPEFERGWYSGPRIVEDDEDEQ